MFTAINRGKEKKMFHALDEWWAMTVKAIYTQWRPDRVDRVDKV